MPVARGPTHPRMLTRVLAQTRLFPNIVRLELRTSARDSSGQPQQVWAPIAPLSRIPARIEPAAERGGPELAATHVVLMVGDFTAPALAGVLLADDNVLSVLRIVDSAGPIYVILRLDADADRTLTRALCRELPAGTS